MKRSRQSGTENGNGDRMSVEFLLNDVRESLQRDEKESEKEGLSQTPKSIMRSVENEEIPRMSVGAKSKASTERRRGVCKTKRFGCEICGFAFGMRSNLKRHIMTVHEDRRGFVCGICDAAFGLKQNLATHVRVKHDKSRPFACEVCGYSFGYKQVLQNHRRNMHGL